MTYCFEIFNVSSKLFKTFFSAVKTNRSCLIHSLLFKRFYVRAMKWKRGLAYLVSMGAQSTEQWEEPLSDAAAFVGDSLSSLGAFLNYIYQSLKFIYGSINSRPLYPVWFYSVWHRPTQLKEGLISDLNVTVFEEQQKYATYRYIHF